MENEGILDCENEDHLLSLHYLFVPRINSNLDSFQSAWNTHPIRTERNLMPSQLWVSGMLHNFDSNRSAIHELFYQQQTNDDDTREGG